MQRFSNWIGTKYWWMIVETEGGPIEEKTLRLIKRIVDMNDKKNIKKNKKRKNTKEKGA